MKRFIAIALVAVFVLGGAFSASAAEFKAKGDFKFSFAFIWNGDMNSRHGFTQENVFSAQQRVRVEMSYIASENLKGVWHIELGTTQWGQRASGGDLSADRVITETKHAYIAFNVPNTELLFKVGIQALALPGIFGSPIFDDDVAAIVASYKFNDMISVVAFWARPYDANVRGTISWAGSTINPAFDNVDMFGLVIPITGDGWSFTPWGVIARAGIDAIQEYVGAGAAIQSLVPNGWLNGGAATAQYATILANSQSNYAVANINDDLSGLLSPFAKTAMQAGAPISQFAYSSLLRKQHTLIAWWAGANMALTMFDPLTFKADVMYGAVESAAGSTNRRGWYIAAAVDYKLDMMTPSIFGFWSSGEDKGYGNGSEEMPWVTQSYGIDSFTGNASGPGNNLLENGASIVPDGPIGKWGIGLQLKDISFIKDLTHKLTFMYARGTNDPASLHYFVAGAAPFYAANTGLRMFAYPTNTWQRAGQSGAASWSPLTTKDQMFALTFDHKYMIYENLAMFLELGWVHVDRAQWKLYDGSYQYLNPLAFAPGAAPYASQVQAPLIARSLPPHEDAFKIGVGLQYKF